MTLRVIAFDVADSAKPTLIGKTKNREDVNGTCL